MKNSEAYIGRGRKLFEEWQMQDADRTLKLFGFNGDILNNLMMIFVYLLRLTIFIIGLILLPKDLALFFITLFVLYFLIVIQNNRAKRTNNLRYFKLIYYTHIEKKTRTQEERETIETELKNLDSALTKDATELIESVFLLLDIIITIVYFFLIK